MELLEGVCEMRKNSKEDECRVISVHSNTGKILEIVK